MGVKKLNRLKKFMQVEVNVKCMETNFGWRSLSSFGDFTPFCFPSKTAKISLQSMDYMSPILALTLAFVAWAVIPYGGEAALSDLGVGVLYILAVSSISVYSILMSGWASNSKYAFLGAIRAAAQMISYEVGQKIESAQKIHASRGQCEMHGNQFWLV